MRIKLQYCQSLFPLQRIQGLLRAGSIFWVAVIFLPLSAHAQSSGSPFDTGFTSLQNLFTGNIAKVASLIAIVVGGYMFAHGVPGAKRFDHGYAMTSHSSQRITADRVLKHSDLSNCA